MFQAVGQLSVIWRWIKRNMSVQAFGYDEEVSMLASRRDALRGLSALVGVAVLPTNALARIGTAQLFSEAEMTFLNVLSDAIIPPTETPGARLAGVPMAFDALMAGWASPEHRASIRRSLGMLSVDLNRRGAQAFVVAPTAVQQRTLAALDADAFGELKDKYSEYREIKALLVRLYYRSEAGATEELQYDAIPGEWRACAPLTEIGRTWAT